MKTIGELRKLLLDNKGEIKIGDLVFSYEEGKDIDINLCNHLLMWLQGNNDDSCLLEKINFSIASEYEEEKREKTKEENKTINLELEQTKKKLEIIENEKKDFSLFIGKVEAYEKLLMGRDVTISK